MFKLVIQDDEGKTTVVPLIRDEITIGRKEGNTIRLTERNVSRRHARILRTNGEVSIEDLGSYNGIRVNNARIAERVALRVSDQVQIGDYKLYLKAEGVEQVDDARTMPIERVDTANTATDVIPAVAAPAPTQPMVIPTPAPGSLPAAAQLIGNPNRTLVAVADTDPHGRPVASPAQVAAVLSSPVGYGKLVVLSSNFAGKEFELSRPQMIIGRTDENDIVVNHRSISRNHAKLVREPDSGRYTISDLQSSNGVRVNGQDYGKVELRRGDVVDLGHVRLRFIEGGEDFVFSRDAVITDVPDSGSKKGLWIALGAALVLVIGVVVVMMMKKDDGGSGTKGGNVAVADAGDIVAVNPAIDAANTAESNVDAAVTGDDPKDRLKLQCAQALDGRKWDDLITCATQLKNVDKAMGDKFYATAHEEQKAEASLRALGDAITEGSLKKARTAYDAIGEESVYKRDAEAKYTKLANAAKDELTAALKKYVSSHDCRNYNARVKQERGTKPGDIVDAAQDAAGKCEVIASVPKETPKETPKEPCNADELSTKGQDALSGGNAPGALVFYEQAYRCKPSGDLLRRVMLTACAAKNIGKAQKLYKNADTTTKNWMIGACANKGVFQKDLEGQ